MSAHAVSVPGALQVRVRSITYLSEGVNAYEVVPVDGSELPTFTAGSHVDLYFRDGRVRQYSLYNDPSESHRYAFAVQREEHGRGGSKAVHDVVHAGRILQISTPRNHFPLVEAASHHVLIAGGIGVTPIIAMIHRLLSIGASFELHYAARTHDRLAFSEYLSGLGPPLHVHTYVDGGDPQKGMQLDTIVSNAPEGSHFYCCGPEGLMRAVSRASAHLPAGTAHFEHFAVPAQTAPQSPDVRTDDADAIAVGFKVKLAKSGQTFAVPDDKSIVDVLRENGVHVDTSCQSGLCGTCRTRYLEGEPDHRDYVLDDEARRHEVLVCCARSKSPLLVLDL